MLYVVVQFSKQHMQDANYQKIDSRNQIDKKNQDRRTYVVEDSLFKP